MAASGPAAGAARSPEVARVGSCCRVDCACCGDVVSAPDRCSRSSAAVVCCCRACCRLSSQEEVGAVDALADVRGTAAAASGPIPGCRRGRWSRPSSSELARACVCATGDSAMAAGFRGGSGVMAEDREDKDGPVSVPGCTGAVPLYTSMSSSPYPPGEERRRRFDRLRAGRR